MKTVKDIIQIIEEEKWIHEPVYLCLKDKDAYPNYRLGEPRKVVGIVMASCENYDPRLCYKFEFEDGTIDYSPVSNHDTSDLVTLKTISKPFRKR